MSGKVGELVGGARLLTARGQDARWTAFDAIDADGSAVSVWFPRAPAVVAPAAHDRLSAGVVPIDGVLAPRRLVDLGRDGWAVVCDPMPEPRPWTPAGAIALSRVVARLHAAGFAHGAVSTLTAAPTADGAVVAWPAPDRLVTPVDGAPLEPTAPPELAHDEARTEACARRADVYACGAIAHLALVGAWPSGRGRRSSRRMASGLDAYPSVAADVAGTWPGFAAAIDAALASPGARVSSAAVLAALLEQAGPRAAAVAAPTPPPRWTAELPAVAAEPPKRTSRRTRLAWGAAIVVVAAAVAAVLWSRRPAPPYDPTCRTVSDCAAALDCVDGMCAAAGMAYVAPGDFRAGSIGRERGQNEPSVNVTLTRGFYIDQREVTQAEFAELTGTSPAWFSGCGPACPVESVNWFEAVEYANRMSTRDGLEPCYALDGCSGTLGEGCPELRPNGEFVHECAGSFQCASVTFVGLDCEGYRLPTELEWERAARAGSSESTYAGPLRVEGEGRDARLARLGAIAVSSFNAGVDYEPAWPCEYTDRPRRPDGTLCGPSPVGSKLPNPFGLYDTLGNVVEWTHDVFHEDTRFAEVGGCSEYRIGPSGNRECFVERLVDRVADGRGPRTLRGGAWLHSVGLARAAARGGAGESSRWNDVGFRLARTAAPPRAR